ncbi:MAG: AMP-binding protein [Parvularculaceae bacterium]
MRPYPLEERILGAILQDKAAAHPSKTFLKFHDGERTYRDVDDMANRIAQGLITCGVKQHSHVAVMLPNCADFLFAMTALAKLGAVAAPINTAFKGDILRHVLDTSDVSAMIVDELCLGQLAAIEDRLPRLRLVIVRTDAATPNSNYGLSKRVISWTRLLNFGHDTPSVRVRYCDLQSIMFTSGTTGPSKGVMVPHAHALTDALDSKRLLAYRPDDTIYCPLPLFHAAALWDGFMTALLTGCSIAIVERFSASRFWTDIRRFGATVAMGIFSMIPILLKQPPAEDDKDHSLRALYLGKSSLDEAFYARFGVHAVESYTSTEIGVGACSPYGEWRVGSCGRANETTHEIAIVDAEDNAARPGEPGEIVVRPRRPYVMTLGYYNDPSATAHTFRNLWFHTGDRGYRDADGYFYFVERMKDCIRRRGENISAFEVEQIVNAHPAVLESAAFAAPSDIEEDTLKVAAVLVSGARLDSDELAAFCRARLPAFMIPELIEFVDALPRSAIGKIAKHRLREQARREMAAQTPNTTPVSRSGVADVGGAVAERKP